MRRFELVDGTAAKFWEIGQTGSSVTVRFGRIGTNGQQQVKDLRSDTAAAAHVTKLVAEKTRKGYTETGTSPDPDPAPPVAATAVEPDAAVEPAVEPAAEPAAEPAVAPAADTTDEDVFVLPPGLRRQVHPRRDRPPVPPVTFAADVHDRAQAHVATHWPNAQQLIGHQETDPQLTAAVSAPEVSPLGMAVVLRAVVAVGPFFGEDSATVVLVDDLAARYGLGFAAQTMAEAAGIELDDHWHQGRYGLTRFLRPRTDADEVNQWYDRWEQAPRRVRALLAAASDDEYAAVVAALAQYRTGVIHQRVVTSYLVPTQRQWVREDIARIAELGATVTSSAAGVIGTPDDLQQLLPYLLTSGVTNGAGLLASVVDVVGPAAAPALAGWWDGYDDGDVRKRIAALLASLPSDEAFDLLVDRLDQKYVPPAVLEASRRFPRRAMRLLAQRAGTTAVGRLAGELLQTQVRTRPEVVAAVRASLSAAAAARIDAVTTLVSLPAATELPAVLTSPPWAGKRTRTKAVVLDLTPPPGAALRWQPGEREAWSRIPTWYDDHEPRTDWRRLATEYGSGGRATWWEMQALYLNAPEPIARTLLPDLRPDDIYDGGGWLKRVVARFELDALPAVTYGMRSRPVQVGSVLLPFVSSEIAAKVADWSARSKVNRPIARQWLDRHPADAALGLVPPALGKPGVGRRTSEAALRYLAAQGHRETVERVAAGYSPEAAAAIGTLLDTDPLDVLPARMPNPPTWLEPEALPAVLTGDREHVLPPEAVRHLVTMLQISRPDEVYPGLDLARAACDPASLAELGWALLTLWSANGFPSKDGWVLDALGLVGDDETVRRLTPLIRAWPGDSAHKRAVTGLDVLAAIGTDIALMHLHGISQKVKFRALREHARAKVDEIAENMGLTAEELADRLVPDFGLDADGTLALDYGPRTFVVGFDEQLKPTVSENGVRRRDLPKPGAKDDAELATPAYERFRGMKKDVRTIATDQIRRLEAAMVASRRWTPELFTTLFVDHPLLVHVVRRLVWSSTTEAGTAFFRVAEDRTLADVEDEQFTPPADAAIAIAHPLGMGAAVPLWSEIFADYEILQPFEQLGRETFALTGDERRTGRLTRFEGKKVKTVKVLSLSHRGWQRDSPEDAGIQPGTYRTLPDGGSVQVQLNPGIVVGDPTWDEFAEQTLDGVHFDDARRVDDVAASEVLRDLTWLVT